MKMAFKAIDWWSEKGLESASKGLWCAVCGSGFGIALLLSGIPVCRLHSNCSEKALELIIALKARQKQKLLTHAEWKELRLNSWDRDALIPYVSDKLLATLVEYTLGNCRSFERPASVYDEALQLYTKELNSRFRKKISNDKEAS
jgi:transcription initiation factor TFIIIB Brf1 subunit/transcription initiation factor TFIIB